MARGEGAPELDSLIKVSRYKCGNNKSGRLLKEITKIEEARMGLVSQSENGKYTPQGTSSRDNITDSGQNIKYSLKEMEKKRVRKAFRTVQ